MNMEGSRDDLSLPLLGAGEAEEADRSTGEVVLDIDGSTTSSSQSASSGNGECARTQQSSSENPFDFLGVTFSLDQPTPLDPFRNHTHAIEGAYEWFKILVCIPIALLRLLLFGLSLLVGFLATKLALQGWKDRKNPMPKWRCRVMWVTRLSTRCILFCFGYHWIKRIGRPASREIAPIVVSNHVSYIEPIFFFYELFPTIVASESHDRLPFVGTIIRAMQVIYVDRFSASSRKHAVSEIKRKASCSSFPRVLLFPEGTTTNGRALISFQLGAFIPGFPIQPVAIRYPHVHFDQSWGHISLAKLMFRMFTQFHNFMEVEYLPVISPLVNRKENAVHLAERTRYAIASTLNIVQTSHSYGDLMLLSRASQLGKDKLSAYLVEMATVESSFNMSTLEALEFQDRFFAMNPDPSGRVKIHDFLRVLRLGFSGLSKKIFAFVDVEKRGSITFRQFLYGSALIMKQPSFQRTCTVAFEECDDEGKGYITKQQFGDAIRLAVVDMTDENVCELFKLFDIDNDESISREEFMSCLRKYPLLVAFFAPCTGHHNLLLFEAEEMANF